MRAPPARGPKRVAIGLAALVALAACGGGRSHMASLLAEGRGDDRGEDAGERLRRVAALAVERPAEVAVGWDDETVRGVALADGAAWSHAIAHDGPPVLAGGVVVVAGGGALTALDARTGEPLWSRTAGGALRGAGDDGHTTVVSLATRGERRTTLLAIARSGGVLRQLELAPEIGPPAVAGPWVILPWEGRVSVYDVATGEETVRVALGSGALRIVAAGDRLLACGDACFRFEPALATDPARARFAPASHALPVAARFSPDGAIDGPTLVASPDAGAIALVAGSIVVSVGADGALGWARAEPSPPRAVAAFATGLAACEASGRVAVIDGATGEAHEVGTLGAPVAGCAVQALPSSLGAGLRAGGPRAAGLEQAIRADEPALVPLRRALLDALAADPSDPATRALVALAADPALDRSLGAAAGAAIAARRTGAAVLVDALAAHRDLLHDRIHTAPAGPIADALAAQRADGAAAALAARLADPALDDDELERVADALAALAGPAEVPALRAFFALYRASAAGDAEVRATCAVAGALARAGGAEGRAIVERAAKDRATTAAVRAGIARAVGGG